MLKLKNAEKIYIEHVTELQEIIDRQLEQQIKYIDYEKGWKKVGWIKPGDR